jgi:hypothetical protein
MDFKKVKELIIKPNGKIYQLSCKKIYTVEVLNWINENIKSNDGLRAKVYLIENNLTEPPKCKNSNCNNYTNWNKMKYTVFCSNKCSNSSKETREKYKKTSLIKYGVENPLKSNIIREKCYNTMFIKRGVKTAIQSKEGKEKWKKSMEIKYGVNHNFKSKDCQRKIEETNLKRYNVRRPCQNKDILTKSLNNSKIRTHKFKEYDLYYQSKLELLFLELLDTKKLLKYVENGISFNYEYNGKHKYVSDFYIPSTNTIIEIKSKWTFDNRGHNKEMRYKNLEKYNSVKNSNYSFKLLIGENEIKKFIDELRIN